MWFAQLCSQHDPAILNWPNAAVNQRQVHQSVSNVTKAEKLTREADVDFYGNYWYSTRTVCGRKNVNQPTTVVSATSYNRTQVFSVPSSFCEKLCTYGVETTRNWDHSMWQSFIRSDHNRWKCLQRKYLRNVTCRSNSCDALSAHNGLDWNSDDKLRKQCVIIETIGQENSGCVCVTNGSIRKVWPVLSTMYETYYWLLNTTRINRINCRAHQLICWNFVLFRLSGSYLFVTWAMDASAKGHDCERPWGNSRSFHEMRCPAKSWQPTSVCPAVVP